MKKALIITDRFPNTGGTRVEKFIKYLPEFGWQPIVLTRARSRKECRFYEVLREDFSDVNVYETPDIRNFHVLKKLGLRALSQPLNKFFFFPDTYVGWAPFAVRRGKAIIKNENISLIFTSSPPESVHLVGYLLSKRTGKPWVSDFRDLWLNLRRGNRQWKTPTWGHEKCAEYLEAKFLESADHVVANTEAHQKSMTGFFNVREQRVSVIPNGYDDEDFEGVVSGANNPSLTLGLLGGFEGSSYSALSRLFLEALADANNRIKPRIRLVWCGHPLSPSMEETFCELGLENDFDYRGILSHGDAIKALAEVNVLLSLGGTGVHWNSVVPQKLYQYLRFGKPILALAPSGSQAEKVVMDTATGWVVVPDDRQAITKKLKEIHELWRASKLSVSPNKREIAGYSRREQAGQLAAVFNKLSSPSSGQESSALRTKRVRNK